MGGVLGGSGIGRGSQSLFHLANVLYFKHLRVFARDRFRPRFSEGIKERDSLKQKKPPRARSAALLENKQAIVAAPARTWKS